MYRRSVHLSWLLAVSLMWSAGCGKKDSGETSQAVSGSSAESAAARTIAKFHWAGKDHVAADTNAHDLMVIWNVPESVILQNQTLGKLASAPWRLIERDEAADVESGSREELLRPVLDDLLHRESYLEISQTGDQFPVLALATRLDDERARTWSTNLAEVLHSLSGQRPEPSTQPGVGWSVSLPDSGRNIELTHVGEWTILGLSEGSNDLTAEFVSRITANAAPYDKEFTSDWINAEVDLARVAAAYRFSEGLPENLPNLTLRVNGDGQYVRTRGELNFPGPLEIDLEPWNVPTNLITGDLHSLVAVRGIRNLLAGSKTWSKLGMGSPPNQIFSWGYDGLPAQVYFAAPISDASNRVENLTSRILEEGKEWIATNDLAGFVKSTNFHGLTWNGIPFLYPFLKSVSVEQGQYAVAGSVVIYDPTPAPPAELIGSIFEKTNSVYFDREFTGGQIKQWLYISQFARYIAHQAQLPSKSAGQRWLHAIMPVIGSSGTDVTLTGPAQLSFARTSGSGFTAIELHLLADWLESPTFPLGLHTFVAEPDPLAVLP